MNFGLWVTTLVLLSAGLYSSFAAANSCLRDDIQFTIASQSGAAERTEQNFVMYLEVDNTLDHFSALGVSSSETLALVGLMQTVVQSGLFVQSRHFLPEPSEDELRMRMGVLAVYTRFVFSYHPRLERFYSFFEAQFRLFSQGRLKDAQTSQLKALILPERGSENDQAWSLLASSHQLTDKLQSEEDIFVALSIMNQFAFIVLQQVAFNVTPSLNAVTVHMEQALATNAEPSRWSNVAEKLVEWHLAQATPVIKHKACELNPEVYISVSVPESGDFKRIYRRQLLQVDWDLVRAAPIP
ncbi:MAG: hypothetical protein HRT45_14495 [Bdellovibrionales bacterium]|nr:hypothetical protein [Bdellovibrionales bacterium]